MRVRARIISAMPAMPPGQNRNLIISTLLLMLAFIISAFIMALGHRLLGLNILRVRMGITVGFFLFCFVAIIVYYNLMRQKLARKAGAKPIG